MSSSRPPLLFYCQHSLGLGHLTRSFALCEELARRFRVVLLCGGKLPRAKTPPEGVEVLALPALGAAIDGRLISHDRRRSLERVRRLRREKIVEIFRSLRPEAVLIEFFPFGKRRFTEELIPLLDEAVSLGLSAPIVVSSVRDILVGRGADQEEFDDGASELANRYFDAVLVHSDPNFVRLDESFRPRTPMRTPAYYTGFVASRAASPDGHRVRRDLVVSAGGGIAGVSLMRSAVAAQERLGDVPVRIITGPFFPSDDWRSLQRQAAGRRGLVLKRSVPNLGTELATARGSVSQCGYNTALDLMQAGIPALVVPFAENGEDEQTKRARLLERFDAVRVLDPGRLNAVSLAKEIRSLLRFRPRRLPFDLHGAPNTLRIMTELHADRFGTKAS
jgi:predicted glycosyltransferase